MSGGLFNYYSLLSLIKPKSEHKLLNREKMAKGMILVGCPANNPGQNKVPVSIFPLFFSLNNS
ncbi:MAG: hypothetical protein B5M54_10130 [Candidatus Aminicenantes bacterium 4484_214]|nr:MAG: hypothetical protein B5M54_10130 [Candidatus Aminicenantes bacterium 4484_214]